jgi:hypothetical protein
MITLPADSDREGAFPMNGFDQKHHERLERFVRSENVARFRHLLATATDEAEREMLVGLLNKEQEKQSPGG